MKKLRLQITIERTESWRISKTAGDRISTDASPAEIISLPVAEKIKDVSPSVYRRTPLIKSIFNHLNRLMKIARLDRANEKGIQKKFK